MEQEAAVARGRAGRPKASVSLGVRRRASSEIDPLLRAALDVSPAGMIILDSERRVRLITRAAGDLLGVGMAPRDGPIPVMRLLTQSYWLDSAALQTLAAAFNGVDTQDPREVLLSVPCPGGARVVGMDLRRIGQQGWVACLSDVTQSRDTQDWLLEQASTDPITGLWNRQHFMLMLHDRLDGPQAADTVLLLLDLKRFKVVNDALGTAAGDSLLRLVGGRLSGYLREQDLLSRFASDEFAIMLGEAADHAAIAGLSERLNKIISEPFIIDG